MHWLNGETLGRFEHCSVVTWDLPVGSNDKESACNMGDLGLIPQSPGDWDGNSLQCSCWRIQGTEEPGGLYSLGLQRVGQTEQLTLS